MHSPTLLMMTSILMGIVTAVLASMWFFNRNIPGLCNWMLSYLSGFCLSLLFLSRASLPEPAFVLLSQTLMFLIPFMSLAGARAYVGHPPIACRHAAGILVVLIGVALYFTVAAPSPGARFASMSLSTGVLFLCGARTLASGRMLHYPIRHLLALTCGAHGLFLMVRPLLFGPGDAGLFDASYSLTVSQFVMLESIIAMTLMAFGILMLANEHSATELRRLAERDALTNVFNRRSFTDLLEKAVSHSKRSGQPVSVLVVDLDHFKSINDTWGHKGGDDALRHFVTVASGALRNEDVIGRLGGEEFAILLSNAGLQDATASAERVRAAVANTPLPVQHGTIALTASFGVVLAQQGESAESILDRGDKAMYRAKNKGRNRVEAALSDHSPLLLAPTA